MHVELPLNKAAARLAVLLLAFIGCAYLGTLTLSHFIVGSLTDPRGTPSRDALASAVVQFPNSARLNRRLAEFEADGADRDPEYALSHARRAAELSPNDFSNHVILSSILEAKGDRPAAEASLRTAAALAPNYPNVPWRLANLLLREGKLAECLGEFREAVKLDPSLAPATLDLVWRATGGNRLAIESLTAGDPEAQLALARLLLKRSLTAEAVSLFNSVDRRTRLASRKTPEFIEALISSRRADLARESWLAMITGETAPNGSVVWNSGFESDPMRGLAQFDWVIGQSDYARISVDRGAARSGNRALRVDFAGRDTTRLEGEVKQLLVLKSGGSYRLECYAKTKDLTTPEGPRIVVADAASSVRLGTSAPIAAGSNDWSLITVDFVVPRNAASGVRTVYISIQRTPKFSYDEPTLGTVWLDDFTVNEIAPASLPAK
ncbi:MAG TPA: tetratricopeptide repeat protein [Blastocatellia bacterium]|nr:tetratricopeptide repeat protein [Blastocatellia bacterium]